MAVVAASLRRRCVPIASATALLLAAAPALAAVQVLTTTMSGAAEVPGNGSTATGTCAVTVDDVANTVSFSGTFTGLGAAGAAAGLNGLAAPGIEGPVIVPAGTVTSAIAGSFSGGGSVAAADVAGILAGRTYCEVDDAAFPQGEIRGQIGALATPALERAHVALLLLGLGLTGLVLGRRFANLAPGR
jgi:hypothetical protein